MDFREYMCSLDARITEKQAEMLETYYTMLIDWNENRCNLTAIKDVKDVAQKHFADSILPIDLIAKGAHCIDIGTGAGFPGVPIKIMRPDIELVLLDSLNKRIDFLNELLSRLGIQAKTLHMRAEDAARDIQLRERFDVALTRAVAGANVLMEWTTPFLKVGGCSLMYKGTAAQEELLQCENAMKTLRLNADIVGYNVPWGERSIICVTKNAPTPKLYPRKAGMAKKNPL